MFERPHQTLMDTSSEHMNQTVYTHETNKTALTLSERKTLRQSKDLHKFIQGQMDNIAQDRKVGKDPTDELFDKHDSYLVALNQFHNKTSNLLSQKKQG